MSRDEGIAHAPHLTAVKTRPQCHLSLRGQVDLGTIIGPLLDRQRIERFSVGCRRDPSVFALALDTPVSENRAIKHCFRSTNLSDVTIVTKNMVEIFEIWM